MKTHLNVTDALLFPFAHAKEHFTKAQKSEWLGRTVHYIVGTLEYIPLLNYLVVAVELAVLHLFAACQKMTAPAIKIDLPVKFDQFTLWMDEQHKNVTGFIESAKQNGWGNRLRGIKAEFEEFKTRITGIIEDPRMQGYDFSQWQSCLTKLDNSFKDRKATEDQLCANLLQTVAELKPLDLNRQMFLEEKLRVELAKIPPAPQFNTWDDYFKFIGIVDFADQLGASKERLPAFGLTNLQDLEKLQLNRFQTQIERLNQLECCKAFNPQAAEPLIQQIMEKLPRGNDKQRQINELKAYIGQQDHHMAWVNLKKMGIHTLSQFCDGHPEESAPSSLLQIGAVYSGR
jgi:hypothetical protein